MNLWQAFKMAWRSILGKRGRSALTVLSIFIGIAAVMTIVSIMEGMKVEMKKQYEAMGSNRISVDIYSWVYDNEGNPIIKDYYPDLSRFCKSENMREYIIGVTPQGNARPTVTYGTKSTANMEWEYDDNWNVTSAPPQIYYGSEQYAICSNLTIAKGRDMAYLDIKKYNNVCVLGAQAAKLFFGTANPVGEKMDFNGHRFTVVGVYASRGEEGDQSLNQIDNIIVIPYTATRLFGGTIEQFVVKARSNEASKEASNKLRTYLNNLVDERTGSSSVYAEDQWSQYQNESLNMIGLVLGGIAAISLLVGGIGIMNMMLVTVTERTREIGIRRAIGAQRSSIVAQFLIEAGMLCGIGGIVGIAFGTLGSVLLSRLIVGTTVWPLPWVTAAAFGLSVGLGVVFGCYPAMKASKLQPVEALRAE